jgi:glycerol-3-phosphate dehydrogenase
VGGGINGAGIARDAAGRGLRVCLVEQHDLAAHTSSASTKLIHGGLRYLEQYEFRLVREALAERERLLAIAPHIIRPLRFVLPYAPGMRPRWLLRLGLFVYDNIGRRERLAASQELDLSDRGPGTLGAPLHPQLRRGFEYSDCWVEDSRLVVLNALDAAERGARVHTRLCIEEARVQDGLWQATGSHLGARVRLRARALVNATGAWVDGFSRRAGVAPRGMLRLVKGSHLVFPRLYEGAHAWLLQSPDRRVVFLIPYEEHYTLAGTTDVPFDGNPAAPRITAEEARYLCDCINLFLQRPVRPEDALGAYSGVRALYDEDDAGAPQRVSRDYRLELRQDAGAPLLSVLGGKITTYRRLAEHAMELLLPRLGSAAPDWTAGAALPGGDLPDGDLAGYTASAYARWPGIAPPLLARLARSYGTRMARVLGGARTAADLGADLGLGLHERELAYLANTEWARTAEDVLLRRTRLGLAGNSALERALRDYFSTNARSMT